MGLDLDVLRKANLARLPQFKNAKGNPAHTSCDGSDWSPTDWMTAVTGELGEAANLIKKLRRDDFSLEECRDEIADELADVLVYLDILCYQLGIDLSDSTINKWNKKSEQVDCDIRISEDGVHLSEGTDEMIAYGCGYEISEGEFGMFHGPCLTLDKAMECPPEPAGNDYSDRAVILKFKGNPPVSEITHRWNRLDRSWHPV